MYSLDKSGDDDAVDTPLPIPNREVKHCSGEGSRNARITRCRAFFMKNEIFYLIVMIYTNFLKTQILCKFKFIKRNCD